jgi:hypothetical protein
MIRKIFILSTCALSSTIFSAENEIAAKQNQNNYYDDQMMMTPDCSDLTMDEQNFASQLNDTNAMMFCSKMTPMQRQKAMQLNGTRGPSGKKMTPDDAVQSVMKSGNMQGTGKGQRGSSACPVQ